MIGVDVEVELGVGVTRWWQDTLTPDMAARDVILSSN